MNRITLITIILLVSITAYATINIRPIQPGDKTELVKLVLEDVMKIDPVEGSLLIIQTPILNDIDLQKDVNGVPVMFITMAQLEAWETNSVSIHAIYFTKISVDNLSGHVEFRNYYNSYWPGWNGFGSYDFISELGKWIIYSKSNTALV
jgi:hypothetical protein